MATTLPSNTVYQDPFFESGFVETITQNIAAFNA